MAAADNAIDNSTNILATPQTKVFVFIKHLDE
jgi:hypothetical protein